MSQKNNSDSLRAPTIRFALTIAGSDSGGGAGIQADLKAFAARGVFGLSAITAVTAQNSRAVDAAFPTGAEAVTAQLAAVLSDFPVHAVKTGMLVDAATIDAVAAALAPINAPVVIDPVMIASSGARLLHDDAITALKKLCQRAILLTPNLPEAETLLDRRIENRSQMLEAARALLKLGPQAILLKGGHGNDQQVWDLLLSDRQHIWHRSRRLKIVGHGTGCTLSAQIAAGLALGHDLPTATRLALRALRKALADASPIGLNCVTTPDPFSKSYRAHLR